MTTTAPLRRTNLRSAATGMAIGTTLSRFTGLLRVLVLAAALGFSHLSDAYNLANTAPNMLYDIILGGILSATFIPVFVERLALRDEEAAWRAISAVITLSVVVLVTVTIAFWFLAPVVISGLTALDHSGSGTSMATIDQEREVATTLLRWFVPQVALYGMIGLATALLNTRHRFLAPMWTPIANNLVCIGILLTFLAVTHQPTLLTLEQHRSLLVLLGLGTTLGVLAQALLLIPSLRAARLTGLRWHWEPGHEAVRTIVRLGGWTFGFVMANQIALFVILALAVGTGQAGAVSSYQYAYIFLQLPYGIIAVSIMSGIAPDLAARWSTGQIVPFRHRMVTGLRAILSLMIPAAVGMLLLARLATSLLFSFRASGGTSQVAATLAMFSLGLPGFCAFLYVIRVLQSMQRARTAFWLYLLENSLNVALGVALVGPLGVRGLALALSVAYSVGAVVGILLLRSWLGSLGGSRPWLPIRRVLAATAVMAVTVLVVSNLSAASHGPGLAVRVVAATAAGGLAFLATVMILGAWSARRGTGGDPSPPGGPTGRGPKADGPLHGRDGRTADSRASGTSGVGPATAAGRVRLTALPGGRPGRPGDMATEAGAARRPDRSVDLPRGGLA